MIAHVVHAVLTKRIAVHVPHLSQVTCVKEHASKALVACSLTSLPGLGPPFKTWLLACNRSALHACRQYVDQEIGNVAEICSPFQRSSALNRLLQKTSQWQKDGVHTAGIVTLIKELMSCQSSRSAASVHILSPVHWIMMWTIGVFFVANFIIFETGTPGTSSVLVEDRIIFAVLCGLSTSVLLVLHDLSDAENGTYSYRVRRSSNTGCLQALYAALSNPACLCKATVCICMHTLMGCGHFLLVCAGGSGSTPDVHSGAALFLGCQRRVAGAHLVGASVKCKCAGRAKPFQEYSHRRAPGCKRRYTYGGVGF